MNKVIFSLKRMETGRQSGEGKKRRRGRWEGVCEQAGKQTMRKLWIKEEKAKRSSTWRYNAMRNGILASIKIDHHSQPHLKRDALGGPPTLNMNRSARTHCWLAESMMSCRLAGRTQRPQREFSGMTEEGSDTEAKYYTTEHTAQKNKWNSPWGDHSTLEPVEWGPQCTHVCDQRRGERTMLTSCQHTLQHVWGCGLLQVCSECEANERAWLMEFFSCFFIGKKWDPAGLRTARTEP